MPRTALGKWSVALIVGMPLLFYLGGWLADRFYPSVLPGDTIWEVFARPALALAVLAGIACGIAALITGLTAVARRKERAPSVYGAVAVGAVLVLFLLGEVLLSPR